MTYSNEKTSGALFLIASTQFVLGIIVSEALHAGYSVYGNYISDLGVGPSAVVFNSSAFLFGLLSVFGAYLLPRTRDFRVLTMFLGLMAVGAMGTGIFTKNYPAIHGAVALMAFGFGGLSAIVSFKILKTPFSLISIILGSVTLVALALFSCGILSSDLFSSIEAQDSVFFLGIGPGGMERMIIYPALVWLTGFGGHLIAMTNK